jgi:flagellar motor protein MotB
MGGNDNIITGACRIGSTLAILLVAGCSSIPDDMNPGTWVSGASDWVSGIFGGSSDTASAQPAPPPAPAETPKLTEDARPKTDTTTEKQKIAEGLVSDRANAQYTQAEQEREGEATRPLETEKAEAPAPAPAPVAKTTETAAPAPVAAAAPAPAPSSSKTLVASAAAAPPPARAAEPSADDDSVVAPSARVKLASPDLKTATPPPTTGVASAPAPVPAPAPTQMAAAAPPPPPKPTPAPPAPAAAAPAAMAPAAPAPASVSPRPVASAANGDIVGSVYRQRLAEFSAGSGAVAGRAMLAPTPAPAMSDVGGEGSTAATKVTAAHGAGGAHPLSALDQAKAAASFQVAEIMFGEGTADLGAAEEGPLRAVADVYRESKGAAKIGIVGHSDSERLDVSVVANRESNRSLAAERAAAVARVLERMGVPAAKIYAGATGETAGDYAEVFVAY